MNCGELCTRETVFARKGEMASDIAKLMREHDVGSVIVVEGEGERKIPVGILTDRDLVVDVMAKGLDQNKTSIDSLMCCDLIMAKEDDQVPDTLKMMWEKGVRRVPVVDKDGHLKGVLSASDVMETMTDELFKISKLRSTKAQSSSCH